MKPWLLTLTVALIAIPAFADALTDAKAVNEAFIKAANVTDPEESIKQVAALFTDDMHHVGLFGVVNGKPELLKALQGPFHAQKRHNELVSNEATALDKDTVLLIAHFTTSFVGPDGKEVSLPLRCTRLVKKQKDGHYLIAAEHTSFGPPPPPTPPSAAN